MKFIAGLLVSVTAFGMAGCNDPLTSDYDAHSDTVQCSTFNGLNSSSQKWVEKGYVCHLDPSKRVPPNPDQSITSTGNNNTNVNVK